MIFFKPVIGVQEGNNVAGGGVNSGVAGGGRSLVLLGNQANTVAPMAILNPLFDGLLTLISGTVVNKDNFLGGGCLPVNSLKGFDNERLGVKDGNDQCKSHWRGPWVKKVEATGLFSKDYP